MNEAELQCEVIQLHLGGASIRSIARMLRISRHRVARVLRDHARARTEGTIHPDLPVPKTKKGSKLDEHDDFIRDLLARFPDVTAVRLHQELSNQGYQGGYTIVRERLAELRPSARKPPVERFETAPGLQGQMDYSPYQIDFLRGGTRWVHAFSYVLGYSRRQYLHFVESEDFETTIREHVRAFEYFQGLPRTCLYDNMKVVVAGYDGEEPVYNTRFLAFANHYDFRPIACRRRRSQTKGKVERPFDYVEKNLLNARSFRDLAHLNEVAAWWLSNVADVRNHRETSRRPIDLFEEEQPHLLALPEHPYDTSVVVYRVVDVEGCVSYRGCAYSMPWRLIGDLVPVKVSEDELIAFGKDLVEVARHPLFGREQRGEKRILAEHRPRVKSSETLALLQQRFESFGPGGLLFLDGLVQQRRYGKKEASRVLALLELYRREDIARALERATKYGAFSHAAVERILSISAEPRCLGEVWQDEAREHLADLIGSEAVPPRETSDYQHLLGEGRSDDEEEGDDTAGDLLL